MISTDLVHVKYQAEYRSVLLEIVKEPSASVRSVTYLLLNYYYLLFFCIYLSHTLHCLTEHFDPCLKLGNEQD